jgi:hypothetical protein
MIGTLHSLSNLKFTAFVVRWLVNDAIDVGMISANDVPIGIVVAPIASGAASTRSDGSMIPYAGVAAARRFSLSSVSL